MSNPSLEETMIEITKEYVLSLIKNGESDSIEFKYKLPAAPLPPPRAYKDRSPRQMRSLPSSVVVVRRNRRDSNINRMTRSVFPDAAHLPAGSSIDRFRFATSL